MQAPPWSPATSTILIGRDRRGNWVVREENGLFGGLFVKRAEAFKFALSKNGHHPDAIIEVPHEVDLDLFKSQLSGASYMHRYSIELKGRTADLCRTMSQAHADSRAVRSLQANAGLDELFSRD